MISVSKIKGILKLSKTNPVLAEKIPADIFENAVVISGEISSKQLGIVQVEKGLKAPKWFAQLNKTSGERLLVIDNIDAIKKEEQEKFYELLKYKQISGVDLPQGTSIIVLAQDIKNVSETILRLCIFA